ncbi:MAG TPA: methyltransferase domain-containing protein [Verrucomicrobia bacterium]|nr:methyltransferase domain-containing protein [Verrucomicrobiota bacterium]HOB31671.1 50S ribosomal protein L11 methyltransferase [Verrucomicrobiota bacterium]HOP95907.1 50S ribosomal protein L11 methyltransferase [Verrucomicrobiota bacterium]
MKRILIGSLTVAVLGGVSVFVASQATRVTAAEAAATAEAPVTKTPDVIFVPTPQPAVEKMLEMAEIKPGDVVYDLGCGDGRIVVTAARKYGVKAVGFDVDPQRIKESLENVKSNKVEHLVEIKQQDIFTVDLSKADVVTLYLLPSLNVKLIPQLEKMKPGSRIVSYSFDMAGVKPDATEKYEWNTIYKWVTPLKKESSESSSNP